METALGAALDAVFSQAAAPDAFALATRLHSAYARERRGLYVGGESYLAVLDAWAAKADAPPKLIIGVSGLGKSALIANWIATRRATHRGDIIFEHYLGASPDSADPILLMSRLWEHLNQATGEETAAPGADADLIQLADALEQRLAAAAGFAERRGVTIFVALDGLDKLASEPSLRWLPRVLRPCVKLLASSLEGDAKAAAVERGWTELPIEPLALDDRRALLDRTLTAWGRNLSDARAEAILAHPLADQPLFLKTVLEELRSSATHASLDERIATYLGAIDMPGLFTRLLQRLEDDGEASFVERALSLIWASRAGLEETEILAITGAAPLSWTRLRNGLGGSLRDSAGRMSFSHDFLRSAVAEKYLNTDDKRSEAHSKVAGHFQHRQDTAAEAAEKLALATRAATRGFVRSHAKSGSPTPFNRRMEEVPWQIRQSKDWEGLADFLGDLDTLLFAWLRDSAEVRSYWAAVESHSGIRTSEIYAKALASTPDRTPYLGVIGLLLQALGHASDALAMWEVAVAEISPDRGIEYATAAIQLVRHLYHRGDFERALAVNTAAEQALRDAGQQAHVHHLLSQRSSFLLDQGRAQEALALEKQVEAECLAIEDLDGLGFSLVSQAGILKALGEDSAALEALTRAVKIRRDRGDPAALGAALSEKAQLLDKLGASDEAAQLHAEADRLLGRHEVGAFRAVYAFNKACALHEKDNLTEAIQIYEQVEAICRDQSEKPVLVRSLSQKAQALSSLDQHEKAKSALDEAEHIARSLDDRDLLRHVFASRALTLLYIGDHKGALAVHKEEEALARRHGPVSALVGSLANQAIAYSGGLRDQRKAAGPLIEAYGLARAQHLQEELGKVCGIAELVQGGLSNVGIDLCAEGHLDDGLVVLKEHEDFCRAFGFKDGLARSLEVQAMAHLQRRDGSAAAKAAQAAQDVLADEGDGELRGRLTAIWVSISGLTAERAQSLLSKNDLPGALEAFEDMCRQAELGKDAERIVIGRTMLGHLLIQSGDLRKAAAAAEHAHACRTKDTKAELLAALVDLLKKTASLLEDAAHRAIGANAWSDAIADITTRLRLYRLLGDEEEEARCYADEAMVRRAAGQSEEALTAARTGFRIAKAHGIDDIAALLLEVFGAAVKKAESRH